ncbi:hypothetical protein POM88_007723 [Heracleum sosnowskyi]|uniref:Reverse transcriptase zinc-binding domain-containing protein n=1 Tax=Heracleum sosnowskyi TaxID=360622 RepID=A0AAD8N142_9APIA|nr:hypothetical protein POM88_007723 [Heracleum sosnowskyi]
MDLEPQNSTFTWFGKDGKRSKLDRFLLDSVWFSKCQWKVHALGRKHSDHKALILSVEEKNWGGKPFKFFNWWLQEPECVKVIQNFLKSNRAIEVENFQVLLKKFKTEVKGWSRNAKQKLEDNLKLLKDKQDSLDVQNEWNPDAVWCRNELLKGYAKKDSMLRQRARINWSIQGDRNSKFFHQKILRRAYVNGIKKIVWKEKCFSHPESIKSIFFNYFSDFFSKDSGPRVFFLGSLFNSLLGANDRESLEAPFCMQEIETALRQSANDKAPGPDGINFRCLKFLWPNIKGKAWECFRDFEERNCLPSGKWVFNWFKDRDKDWNKWLRTKYSACPSGGIEDLKLNNKSSELLKSLALIIKTSSLGEHLKMDKFRWEVNNGREVLFWEDSWLEEGPLKEKFKRLYLLSKIKFVSVGVFLDLWDCYNKEGEVFWNRGLRCWEKSLVKQLNNVIIHTHLNDKRDVVIWKGGKTVYTAKEGVELLNAPVNHDCNFIRIWRQKVPPKVQIFLWKVLRGIIPTKELLFHRLGTFIDNRKCDVCMVFLEDLKHILWECTFALQVWRKILDWWGFQQRQIFQCLNDTWVAINWFKVLDLKQVWEIVLIATMWTLWLSRNNRIFSGSKVNVGETVKLIKLRSQEWALARNLILEDAVIWWESNPIGVITRSQAVLEEKLLKCDYELICFSDGAWKEGNRGTFRSGIGGVIKSREGSTKLYFSGPSAATSAFEAEFRAFEELMLLVKKVYGKDLSIMCYTDCLNLVHTLKTVKEEGVSNQFSDTKALDFFLEANISVTKVDRSFLQEADYWAKQGSFRASLLVKKF